jgi:hypothetical protein
MIIKRKASELVQLPPRDAKDIKTVETAMAQAEAMRPKMLTPDEVAAKAERNKARQGRFAWGKLHGYRGCDPQWLDIWQYLIPARCDCKDGYQKILEQFPPDFSSPEAFFAWGVALHNAVNAKLGKPQITLDEAYSIWRMNDGMVNSEGSSERS